MGGKTLHLPKNEPFGRRARKPHSKDLLFSLHVKHHRLFFNHWLEAFWLSLKTGMLLVRKKKCEGNNAHVTYAWIRRCYWWVREEHQTNLFCFWRSGPKLEILGAHAEYFGSHIVNLQISSYYSCIHSFIHSLRFLFFRFSGVGFAGGSIISSDAQTSGVIFRSSREK